MDLTEAMRKIDPEGQGVFAMTKHFQQTKIPLGILDTGCSHEVIGTRTLERLKEAMYGMEKGSLPKEAFRTRARTTRAVFGSGSSTSNIEVNLPYRLREKGPWKFLWVPVHGGSAKDVPFLWSIHHWERMHDQGGMELDVRTGVVRGKNGDVAVLPRYQGLLAFPFCGVKMKRGISLDKHPGAQVEQVPENHGSFAMISRNPMVEICSNGPESSPWRTDYEVSGGAFRGVTRQQLLVIVNPKNPYFSRFVRKVDDSQTAGKLRVRFADDRDDMVTGDTQLFKYPRSDEVFEVYVKEIRALLSDFSHYHWVERDQLRVILQSVQANTKRTVSAVWSWPKVRLAWRRRLQQAWKRYRNKRRIQYRKRVNKDEAMILRKEVDSCDDSSVILKTPEDHKQVTFVETIDVWRPRAAFWDKVPRVLKKVSLDHGRRKKIGRFGSSDRRSFRRSLLETFRVMMSFVNHGRPVRQAAERSREKIQEILRDEQQDTRGPDRDPPEAPGGEYTIGEVAELDIEDKSEDMPAMDDDPPATTPATPREETTSRRTQPPPGLVPEDMDELRRLVPPGCGIT